jgi:DNA repair and recombination RAD54-like protein
MIADEAHRLKNAETLTYTTLCSLPCKRRVLLSGTPMQNNLDEFFAMADLVNPGIFGDERAFRKQLLLCLIQ